MVSPTLAMKYFQELLLTFSNKPSLLSSKKIERFVVFTIFLISTIVYLAFHIKDMDATSFIQVIVVWLTYGGANSILLQRDKKLENGA